MHFYRPIVPLRTISSAVWSGTKIHIFVLHGFLSIWLGGRLELFVHYLLDTHRSVCCWEGYVMADCCIVVLSHKLDMLFIVEVQQGNDNMLFRLLHFAYTIFAFKLWVVTVCLAPTHFCALSKHMWLKCRYWWDLWLPVVRFNLKNVKKFVVFWWNELTKTFPSFVATKSGNELMERKYALKFL